MLSGKYWSPVGRRASLINTLITCCKSSPSIYESKSDLTKYCFDIVASKIFDNCQKNDDIQLNRIPSGVTVVDGYKIGRLRCAHHCWNASTP